MAGGIVGAMSNDLKTLTPQQESFAQAVIELDNQSAAYRKAYDVGPTAKWTTVASAANEVAGLPHVAARIKELRQTAAERVALPSAQVRIAEQREIETANPGEIIGVRWVNCRHCHGDGHRFQWIDDMEYAAACDAARADEKAMPMCDGGFGFHGLRDPVLSCTRCWGVGEQRPFLADTTKLSRAAKRLYRGIKIKSDGSMELLLRDQDKATDMLNRIQGIYKDNTASQPPAASTASQVAEAKTPEERQRAYMRVVRGS